MNSKNPSSQNRLTGFEGKDELNSATGSTRPAATPFTFNRAAAAEAADAAGPSAGVSANAGNGAGGAAKGAGGGAGGALKEDVFLSPRVVDRQAFGDFSQSLREIIGQAASTAGALQKAAVEAERSRESLKDALQAQQLKTDHITRLLTGVEQRADQTRKLIEGAGGAVSKIEEVRARADATIEDRLAQFNAKIDVALQAVEAKVSAMEDRFRPLLSEADRRIGTLSGNLDAELLPTIAGLRHLCERAETLIGTAGPDGSVMGGLNDLVSRAEVAKRDASFATRQLDSIRDQADQARQILGESVNAAVPLIDEVMGVQDRLVSAIDQANMLSVTTRQAINDQFRAHQAATDETIARLTADTEVAKTELGASIAIAHEARRAAAAAAITGEEAVSNLSVLLDKLEPWHGVLLARGGAGDNELPVPLREVLDRVRVDLKRDLSFVAAALRSVADRTESAVEPGAVGSTAVTTTLANEIREPKDVGIAGAIVPAESAA